ncbi:SusC/RagA family TonB-linked outer membrane protein [Adhaeribacter aerolatus]|uniref:SusC/RagA family TonB-linked outer membrane protein n=2 Tax=Adhaeribacter aerolatus TaxID=670289 RepID=A0A512B196_9BACT|nr:SusC/RagA family TonB-linked outer membrane protein [Adhaeribacter aerolatus]
MALLGIVPIAGFTSGLEAASSKLVVSVTLNTIRQNGTVTGQVKDSAGQPLPGVSVSLKGTNTGTITDADGRFSIATPDGSQPVLIFTYIGFEKQEVAVGNQSTLNINLREDAKSLSEVVVVGFATQKKVNVTGAVEMITAEDIANRPTTSVSTALQGLLPGLTAISPDGFPGATGATLRVRGVGTTNNSNPFILVDGIPGVDINSLNPDDIESVSVLKDAASAAIYGSRAANGVILITTKTGKLNQKPTIGYNGYVGVQTPTALPKMLGSAEYMEMMNEAQRNVNLPQTYTPDMIQKARDGSDPNYFANTNWTEELFKDYGPLQNHNVSLNGGSADFGYYASYGRQDQKGVVVGDQYKSTRNNAKLRVNANKIMNFLDLDANLSYIDRVQNQPAAGTEAGSGAIYTTLTMSPLTPVRFTNGGWGYGGGSSNPIAIAEDGGFNNFASQEFYGNLSGTIHFLKNLSLRTQYGLNMINQLRSTFSRKIDYFYPETGAFWYSNATSNLLENRDYKSRLENLSGVLNYNTSIGKHGFTAIGGYQQETFRYDTFFASKTNFVSDDVTVFNLGAANPIASGDAYQYALRSYFGRVNYNFDERYLLELNVRYDGSSRYAPGNRYGSFKSGSLGWRFTQESFLNLPQHLPWLNEGKLRVSYGDLGNQYGADGPAYSEWYPYIRSINSVSTMPIGNILTNGLAQTILANPLLQWEKVTMLNAGIDLTFLDNRLTFTGDWFDKRTVDVQLKVPQPDVLGLTVPDQNAGEISNKGWEASLGWNDERNGFRYGATVQVSDVRNEVVNLGGAPPVIADRIRQVGYPIDAFYGYQTDGLAQVDDFEADAGGKLTPKFPIFVADAGKVAPGDIKYRDLNSDGVITADKDRVVIGNAFPRYTYSFRADAAYKGFDLNIFLQGVGKGNGYITGVGLHTFHADGSFPQEFHRDRWTPENTDASYPRFTFKDTRNAGRLSDYWLQNAAYLRLKNIQLGYTLPTSLISKFRLQQLRFYVSGENLFTKTDFFYAYDPENATNSGGLYPQVKTFVFGVNLKLK